MKKPYRNILILFVLCTAYAVARYNLAKGVSWDHFPSYVLNKSISWVGVVLVGLSRVVRDKKDRKTYGLSGLACIGVHVPLSLITLNPDYHERLFVAGAQRLVMHAELSMLAGSVGFMFMIWLYGACLQQADPAAQKSPVLVPRLGRVILAFAAVHITALGYPTWFAGGWSAGLPPITLWSALAAVVFLLLPRPRG